MKKQEQETAGDGCVCPDIKGSRAEETRETAAQSPRSARSRPKALLEGNQEGSAWALPESSATRHECFSGAQHPQNKCHINHGGRACETVELRGGEREERVW